MKFRKKPVVIEAIQWLGDKISEVPEWADEAQKKLRAEDGAVWRQGDTLRIATLEGTMTAQPGDWIIRGVTGELYPCKPDIFAATYEPAAEPDAREDGA